MKRKIITIDQEKCNGCGICVSDCPEGALQMIDGKARLVGDLLCDGLGACLSSCPENAITIEEREAEPYDELKVMANIIPQGDNVVIAHLKHLKDHGQTEFLQQALDCLKEKGVTVSLPQEDAARRPPAGQCPGSRTMSFATRPDAGNNGPARPSQLTHWPIQLHLLSPAAPHYRNADLLLAADCTAFAYADFHKDYLKNRTLAIACPKLDANQDVYIDKLTALIDQAEIKSITVMIMQVPCCKGLLHLVTEAARRAERRIPINCLTVGLNGDILNEERIA
ncbi:MAG TPA: 4Fe-4S binding protein [Acidobacteriota bacterium]|nr:4Fe-4S binding protein [Acidobacteriota bacterium]